MPDINRQLAGTKGAYNRWAREPDRRAATAPARRAFQERFEREVDPTGELDPKERAKRAECARKAYYADLALRSVQARQRKRGAS